LSFTTPTPNIVEVAKAAGSFTTLLSAVQEAGLVDFLSGEGPFTVFAPTDDAFAAVEGLGDIIADKEALTALLQNHVVVGKALASDLSDGQQITAAGGETLNVKVSDSGLMINNANVISADVDASNGVIHVIDAVLSFTTPTPNIVEVAKAAGSFTTLLSAVQEAGLVDFLSGEGPFTVFAPTDDAFAAVDGLEEISLTNNIFNGNDTLTAFILNHVVEGKLIAATLTDGQKIVTIGGETLDVNVLNSSGLMINNAFIAVADVDASNGIIHVIDSVLSFSSPTSNVIEVADNVGSFTTLLFAVQEAGLVDFLSGEGPFTVFAPTDQAFELIDLDKFIANNETLKELIENHVVVGKTLSSDFWDGQTIATVGGKTLTVEMVDNLMLINNADVMTMDVEASNGVIHVINAVLSFDEDDTDLSSSAAAKFNIGVAFSFVALFFTL